MNSLGRLATVIAARCLLALVTILASACNAPDTGILRPELAFTISGEGGLTAARDFTIDRAGNVFIFDYGDYVIRKFDAGGAQLLAFGGTGEEPGLFQHLMAIQVEGDSLFALDAGSVSVFDLAGEFRSRRSFLDTVVCDLPRVHSDGRLAGEWIVQETAEKVLTSRNADGMELDRLESFDLGEFFPGVEPGETFWINPTQVRSYLYDFDARGRLVWAVSDRLKVFASEQGSQRLLYDTPATAIPYPEEDVAALETRQAAVGAPFFMNVPTDFQIIHHLVVDETGAIWLYVKSQEHTGFLRLSAAGDVTGSYRVESEFDIMEARVAVANGRLYFLDGAREEVKVFVVDLP
ncbi:hypothetical protein ACFL3B_01575 [Gemmatimonadota bacterium]